MMRSEKKVARMREIEAAAYALISEVGYEAASMLAVAKRAKASNETMYRWYGDKAGLFESMVRANAVEVKKLLSTAIAETSDPMVALDRVARVLLQMLLGDRAIALNRAAASDPSGALGRLLAKGGREDVLPMIAQLLSRAVAAGQIKAPPGGDMAGLFIRLLVGDQQARRIIGTMAAPDARTVAAQTDTALAQFRALCC